MQADSSADDGHSQASDAGVKVAQIVDELAVGGMERSAVNLANGLANQGLESHMICSRNEGRLWSLLDSSVHAWSARRSSRWDIPGLRRIADYIDRHRFDILHSHNHLSSYLTRVVLAMCRSRPLHVVTDQDGPGLHDRRKIFCDWLMMQRVDGVVAVTEGLRDRAARLIHLPADRCIYVINGIDIPSKLEKRADVPTVVHVANLHWPKDHATAMRAAARVRERVPNLRWISVGRVADPPTPYVREVHALVKELNLEDCVQFTGETTDVRSYLSQAHVGVLSSESEALPLSVLEYMAYHMPVVLTDVGQAPAVVREAQAGVVVSPGDADALAQRIVDLLTDPEKANTLGARGRAHVAAHFSIEAMTADVLRLYHRLLSARVP